MSREFRLPDLGEGVHEGQIVRLAAAEGDHVSEDQPLMEVETDKAAVEIPSPFSGVLERWHVKEGQTVNVGDVMVTFADAASAEAAGETKDGAAGASAPRRPASPAKAQAAAGAGATAVTERIATSRRPASPAVRKLARQMGVSLDAIEGSGPGGRITRADVEAAAKGGGGGVAAPPRHHRAAPPDRARAAPPAAALPAGELPDGRDEADQYGEVRRAPLTQARKTIANVMARSWSTIPHVTDCDDADVTELDRLRRQHNEALAEAESGGTKLTMLVFVIGAVARALQRFPILNASFDAEKQEIIYRRYINIAVGVHTERGLIAPVIRNTDALSIAEIAEHLAEIAHKARTATFAVNDTRGGTYTISNPGAVGGSRYSTPIITPPQVAVLATGRSRWMPWAVDGRIEPRLIMPLSHSFDHRVIDGGDEVAFMRHVIGDLENPGRLIL